MCFCIAQDGGQPDASATSMSLGFALESVCVDTVLRCKRKQWPFACEHGSALSSCTGIGLPLCCEIWLSTWTHSHTKPQRLMILLIVFGIKIQEISHLHSCWGQMWCCSFYGTASQLCHVLNYCLRFSALTEVVSAVVGSSQLAIKEKVKLHEAMHRYWKLSKKMLKISVLDLYVQSSEVCLQTSQHGMLKSGYKILVYF